MEWEGAWREQVRKPATSKFNMYIQGIWIGIDYFLITYD